MIKQSFIILTLLFLVTTVTAQEETYKQGIPINLPFTCSINGAIPSSTATVNITITSPNGTLLVSNQQTTSQGNGAFNYTYTFNDVGTYKVQAFCYDGTESTSTEGLYNITYSGKESSQSQSTIILIALLVYIGFIIFLIISAKNINDEDKKDDYGAIIGINYIKHLRPFLYACSWMFIVFLFFILSNISYAYLPDTLLGTTFMSIFRITFGISIPLVGIWFMYILVGILRDREVDKLLKRGIIQ